MIYAVAANHSVPVQIEHTLATLVARQEFVTAGKDVNVSEIDRLTSAVDTQATTVRVPPAEPSARAIRTSSSQS